MQPEVTIEEFFRAPLVNYHWKITRIDLQLVRFGLSFKPPIFLREILF